MGLSQHGDLVSDILATPPSKAPSKETSQLAHSAATALPSGTRSDQIVRNIPKIDKRSYSISMGVSQYGDLVSDILATPPSKAPSKGTIQLAHSATTALLRVVLVKRRKVGPNR